MKTLPSQIRPAVPSDRDVLSELFLSLLRHLDQFEYDILPTRENAGYFVDQVFLPAAERGEAILLACHDEQPIGAIFCVIQTAPFELRWKQALGYGVYVEPAWRGRGLGHRLRQEAVTLLKAQGVQVLFEMAQLDNKAGLASISGEGSRPYAQMMRFDLDASVSSFRTKDP